MRELSEIRAELDELDGRLEELFVRRLALSGQVAEVKQNGASGVGSVFAPVRESEILSAVKDHIATEVGNGRDAAKETETSAILGQFRAVLRNSRSLQYLAFAETGFCGLPEPCEPTGKSRVFLQGAEGAYQHIAARMLFESLPVVYLPGFEDVFAAVDGESVGVLPLENSTAGVVGDVFDFLCRYDLWINGSLELPIEHTLIGRGRFEQIDTVLAHPQALKQCEGFLREHGIKGVPCTNNAIAAKMVAESDSETIGAICSEECAQIYRLSVLKKGVSDERGNTTRFVVLGTKFERVSEANRLALLFRIENRAGSLAGVLSVFETLGINVLALHSRPITDRPFEYRFYAEFEGRYGEPRVRALLLQLTNELPFVKILGTF